jgi:hypothetical protein
VPKIIDNWPFYDIKKLYNFYWLKNNRVVRIIDNIILNNDIDKFVFYSQNGRHYKYNVFISNPKCIGNHYIEDGLDMYTTIDEYNLKYPSPLKRRYRLINYILGSIQNLRERVYQKRSVFWNMTQDTTFFCLHELSMANNKEIINRVNLFNIQIDYEDPNLKELPFLLLSALEEQKICSNHILCRVYIKYLSDNNINECYLKWHPAHTKKSKSEILNYFEKNEIKIHVIEESMILEAYFISTYKHHLVLSIGSSLLMYAHLFGKNFKVVPLYGLLHDIINGRTRRSNYWINTYNRIKF